MSAPASHRGTAMKSRSWSTSCSNRGFEVGSHLVADRRVELHEIVLRSSHDPPTHDRSSLAGWASAAVRRTAGGRNLLGEESHPVPYRRHHGTDTALIAANPEFPPESSA